MLYVGDFQQGLQWGYGVQRWPDGHVYTPQYTRNAALSVVNLTRCHRYSGMWRGGLREGEGEYRFSHGDRDGSGVIEDDECDCYRCGVRACTCTHTHYTLPLF